MIPSILRPRRRAIPLPNATRPAGNVANLYVPPPGVPQARLTRGEIAMYQQILAAMLYTDSGRMRPDGVLGPATARAVRAFQADMQPAQLAAETTELGERARALAARVGPLRVDGDLGPETQRWLQWFALPVAEGGGGEAELYASPPVANGVTPTRVTRTVPGRVATAPESVNGGALPVTLPPPNALATVPFVAPPMTTPVAATTPAEVAPIVGTPTPPTTPATPTATPGATVAPPLAVTAPTPPAQAGMGATPFVVAGLVGAAVLAVVAMRPRTNPSRGRRARRR